MQNILTLAQLDLWAQGSFLNKFRITIPFSRLAPFTRSLVLGNQRFSYLLLRVANSDRTGLNSYFHGCVCFLVASSLDPLSKKGRVKLRGLHHKELKSKRRRLFDLMTFVREQGCTFSRLEESQAFTGTRD